MSDEPKRRGRKPSDPGLMEIGKQVEWTRVVELTPDDGEEFCKIPTVGADYPMLKGVGRLPIDLTRIQRGEEEANYLQSSVRLNVRTGNPNVHELTKRTTVYVSVAVMPQHKAAVVADALRIFLDAYHKKSYASDPKRYLNCTEATALKLMERHDVQETFEAIEKHMRDVYGWRTREEWLKINPPVDEGRAQPNRVRGLAKQFVEVMSQLHEIKEKLEEIDSSVATALELVNEIDGLKTSLDVYASKGNESYEALLAKINGLSQAVLQQPAPRTAQLEPGDPVSSYGGTVANETPESLTVPEPVDFDVTKDPFADEGERPVNPSGKDLLS